MDLLPEKSEPQGRVKFHWLGFSGHYTRVNRVSQLISHYKHRFTMLCLSGGLCNKMRERRVQRHSRELTKSLK